MQGQAPNATGQTTASLSVSGSGHVWFRAMSVASWLPVCGPECFSLFFEEDPDPDPSQSRQTSTYQQVKRQVQSQGKDNEGQNSQNQSPTQREARVLAASWDLSGRHAWMPLLTCLVLIALLAAVVGFNHGRAAPEHVAPVVTPDCSQDFSGDVRALAFCCHHFSKHCDDLDHPASSAIGAGIMIGIDPMEDTLDAISARFPPNMAGPEAVPGAKLAGLQNQAGPYEPLTAFTQNKMRETKNPNQEDRGMLSTVLKPCSGLSGLPVHVARHLVRGEEGFSRCQEQISRANPPDSSIKRVDPVVAFSAEFLKIGGLVLPTRGRRLQLL